MNSEILLAYVLASIIIVVVPGPNIILVINDSVKYGIKKSMLTILGIKTGISVLFFIALSGLAALLSMFSSIFIIIKWLGVFYLIYLGINQILSSFKTDPVEYELEPKSKNYFLKGFLISVTNPKGLIFAGAFFPQFIDKQTAIAPQILILCGGFLIISSIIEIIYAFIGDKLGKVFKKDNFKKVTERISGSFLILFGVGFSFVKE